MQHFEFFHEPKAPRPLPNLTQPGQPAVVVSNSSKPLNLTRYKKASLQRSLCAPTTLLLPIYTQSSAELLQSPKMPQDMPPTGGYEPVQYRRNLPVRGFRPAYYLVAMAGICSYGFYRVGQGIREQK